MRCMPSPPASRLALWAAPLSNRSSVEMDQHCLGCHGPGGSAKQPKFFVHPPGRFCQPGLRRQARTKNRRKPTPPSCSVVPPATTPMAAKFPESKSSPPKAVGRHWRTAARPMVPQRRPRDSLPQLPRRRCPTQLPLLPPARSPRDYRLYGPSALMRAKFSGGACPACPHGRHSPTTSPDARGKPRR